MWSVTQYLITYDHGFTKRGLWGSLLKVFFGDTIYKLEFLHGFILIIYVLHIASLVGLALFLLRRSNSFFIPLLVFFSSPAFVLINHIIGYPEYISLVFFTLYIIGFRYLPKLIYSICYIFIFAILFLTNESQVIIWGGIFSYVLFLKLVGYSLTRKNLIHFISTLSITFIILYIINSSYQHDTDAKISLIRDNLHKLTNFQIREAYLDWLVGDSKRTLSRMKEFWEKEHIQAFALKSFIIHLPAFLYFSYYIIFSTNPKINAIRTYISVVLSISPLLMYYFGYDLNRWNTYCVVLIFLFTTVCTQVVANNNEKILIRENSIPFGIFVIILNMNSNNYFFDEYWQNLFPYENHFSFWYDVFFGNQKLPYHPIY